MKNLKKFLLPVSFVCTIICSIALISWGTDTTVITRQKNVSGKPVYDFKNTDTPKTNNAEIQKAMAQVDSAMQEVSKQLAAVDFDKINKQVQQSLTNIDMSAIEKTVNAALKNIDFKTMQANITNSLKDAQKELKNINLTEINAEVLHSLKDMQVELKNIDTKSIQAKIDAAMKELKNEKFIDGEAIKADVQNALQSVKGQLAKAKAELNEVEAFTNELQADGLIDKNKSYNIESKNGKMYINGVEQNERINKKYKKFLDKNRNINTDKKEVRTVEL